MLSKLIQLQEAKGWSDAEMAARLGCARSTWTQARNGTSALSDRLQMRAARAFPELLSELLRTVTGEPSNDRKAGA